MKDQASDKKELIEWVLLTLIGGDISFRPSLSGVLIDLGLTLIDVVNVLEAPYAISTDFADGCYVFRAHVDERMVAVVIARRSEKNRIKIIKVWREDR